MKIKYNPPLKDGKPQYVPIVLKNKDVFVGYIKSFRDLILDLTEAVDLSDENILFSLTRNNIDSFRFNGIGKSDESLSLSDEEFEENEKSIMRSILNRENEHPENKTEDVDNFYEIECECGNSISFKELVDIPEKDFYCDICERMLIQYIGVHDEEVERDYTGE